MPIMLLQLPPLPHMLTINTPKARKDSQTTGRKGNIVRRAVTLEPELAGALTIGLDYGIGVVDSAVEEVVHVAADDGRKGHETPIDGEAIGAKRVDDEGGEDAE